MSGDTNLLNSYWDLHHLNERDSEAVFISRHIESDSVVQPINDMRSLSFSFKVGDIKLNCQHYPDRVIVRCNIISLLLMLYEPHLFYYLTQECPTTYLNNCDLVITHWLQ